MIPTQPFSTRDRATVRAALCATLRWKIWVKIIIGAVSMVGWLPVKAPATTIVMVRQENAAAIAADSEGTFEGGGAPITTKPVCKIYQVEGAIFAVAGLVQDPVSQFSVPEIVARELRRPGPFSDKLTSLETAVATAVEEELPLLMNSDRSGYEKMLRQGDAVSVLLAVPEAGAVSARGFSIHVAPNPVAPGVVLSITNDSRDQTILFAGQHSAIERKLQAPMTVFTQQMGGLAQSLVQLEIYSGAPGVSAPIDVVEVYPGITTWIRRKPNCPIGL
jgi:ATP-dependent protease HslVU (ClpYQ) peptidase subunit